MVFSSFYDVPPAHLLVLWCCHLFNPTSHHHHPSKCTNRILKQPWGSHWGLQPSLAVKSELGQSLGMGLVIPLAREVKQRRLPFTLRKILTKARLSKSIYFLGTCSFKLALTESFAANTYLRAPPRYSEVSHTSKWSPGALKHAKRACV